MDMKAVPEIAEIDYQDGSMMVTKYGTHVICAVTGEPIALEDLRYWSVARQEPYLDAVAALTAWRKYEAR